VAIVIVNLLEMIHIQQNQAEIGILRPFASQHLLQLYAPSCGGGSIARQAGHVGRLAQLALALLLLGHIVNHAQLQPAAVQHNRAGVRLHMAQAAIGQPVFKTQGPVPARQLDYGVHYRQKETGKWCAA